MSTIHTDAQQKETLRLFTKGAPDVLLTRCTHEHVGDGSQLLSSARRLEILKANEELAGRALRTLGIAYRDLPPTSWHTTRSTSTSSATSCSRDSSA